MMSKNQKKLRLGILNKVTLKIVNYHTLHNRGIGMLKQNDHKIGLKEGIQRSIPLLRFVQPFFFQANVLAVKEIIPGDNLFLLPTLRFDKLRRLLLDRNVSQVHSFLKNIHDPKFVVGQFALTDIFSQLFLYFYFFFCLDEKAFVSMPYVWCQ